MSPAHAKQPRQPPERLRLGEDKMQTSVDEHMTAGFRVILTPDDNDTLIVSCPDVPEAVLSVPSRPRHSRTKETPSLKPL